MNYKSNPNLTNTSNRKNNNLKVTQAWHQFIGGDDSAFSLVYETYRKKMCTYGIAIGFCEYLCNDAIQDIFCTLCLNRGKLEHVENVESYLLHCLKNRLFDIYKEQKKLNCTSYDNLIIDQDVDSIGKIINEENQLLINEEVQRLLKKLKPKQRKVVYCRFHHNLKFNEIGVLMDMSPDAVKKLLYRALKIMKQEGNASSTAYNYFS